MDQLLQIGAVVAVLGNGLSLRDGAQRLAELAHLSACVVDVELALDLVPAEGERASQRVAVGRVAGVPDVHRAGGVGRDELDQDELRLSRFAGPVGLARFQRAREGPRQPAVGQKQVQEARPGRLEALEARPQALLQSSAEALRHLARRLPEDRRQQQGRVRGVVAEVGPRRRLQRHLRPAARRSALVLTVARGARQLACRLEHALAQVLERRCGHAHDAARRARALFGEGLVIDQGAAVAILAA